MSEWVANNNWIKQVNLRLHVSATPAKISRLVHQNSSDNRRFTLQQPSYPCDPNRSRGPTILPPKTLTMRRSVNSSVVKQSNGTQESSTQRQQLFSWMNDESILFGRVIGLRLKSLDQQHQMMVIKFRLYIFI